MWPLYKHENGRAGELVGYAALNLTVLETRLIWQGMSDPITASEQRLQEYLSRLTAVLGHADRKPRLVSYCTGLLLPGERKSVEPMAARLDPAQVPSLHQALHHFVATAAWRDEAVLAAVREQVLPALTRHGPVAAWIIDDTSFPKKGRHSVGVARQY